jgi:hypothetical protein
MPSILGKQVGSTGYGLMGNVDNAVLSAKTDTFLSSSIQASRGARHQRPKRRPSEP